MLCEQVIVEEKTRNVSLVSCFTHRTVKQFPSAPVQFTLFALLSDGAGAVTLKAMVQRLDNLEPIFQTSLTAHFPDPLQVVRCIIRLRCPFPEAGHYQVSLLSDGEVLGLRKLILLAKDG